MENNRIAKTVGIKTLCPETPLVKKTVSILKRQIESRSGAKVTMGGNADFTVCFAIKPGIGKEGFSIGPVMDNSVTVTGNDERGLLYGVGKFLRSSRYDDDGFIPGGWTGTSVPETAVRGMYFATHFHNFYHDAPIEKIQEYVEDISLWGLNTLSVWFDMHHYEGIVQLAAQEMIGRLKIVLRTAKMTGMSTSLGFLANEAYANSPVELRADWTAGHDGYHAEPGGHYHVEICPNKPGGRELILKWAEEKLDAFAAITPDYLCIWPYDQGGCTCTRCAPWGANGFLKMAEPIAQLYKKRFPQGKVILSTWYFDHFVAGEWEGITKAFNASKPGWADYLMVDDYGDVFPPYPLDHGSPAGLPMINFPEISMYKAFPWGGYGANPLPEHLQKIWDNAKSVLQGGFPYSEGIYEDMNKAVISQFYWNKNSRAMNTVREYIAFEYGIDVVDDVFEAVGILERNCSHSPQVKDEGIVEVSMYSTDRSKDARALLEKVDACLSAKAKVAWRWRMLLLRAIIDDELVRNKMIANDRCEDSFRELTEIFHAHKADSAVAPMTRAAMAAKR